MKIIVSGQAPFKAYKDSLAIGPSAEGYTLAYSVDKETWTLDDQAVVPANENLFYLGSVQYGWYMLSGNTSNVEVIV